MTCSGQDLPERRAAIEQAITAEAGVTSIPTGRARFASQDVEKLRHAERAGLVTVRSIPQTYWDSFLSQTQNLGAPLDVAPTDKLLKVSVDPHGTAIVNTDVKILSVRVSNDKIETITTDEPYSGPLATLGEKYRLMLGTYRDVPTPAAAVLGMPLATQEQLHRRFRSVLKYDQFAKRWSVVAFDVGPLDHDVWRSNNVR